MTSRKHIASIVAALGWAIFASTFSNAQSTTQPTALGVENIKIDITGGHDTDPRDRGRPVKLIAAALGVSDVVFREAFTHVHPAAGGGGPTDAQARANKAALMNALAKYGVTNDELDRISNFYRYPPGPGGMWKVTEPRAIAVFKDNTFVRVVIDKPGAGFTTAPTLAVPGHPELHLVASVEFGRNVSTNGSIKSIDRAVPQQTPTSQPAKR